MPVAAVPTPSATNCCRRCAPPPPRSNTICAAAAADVCGLQGPQTPAHGALTDTNPQPPSVPPNANEWSVRRIGARNGASGMPVETKETNEKPVTQGDGPRSAELSQPISDRTNAHGLRALLALPDLELDLLVLLQGTEAVALDLRVV